MSSINDEIRRKYPGAAKKADIDRSRAAAIKLHCLSCSGGSRSEVSNCLVYDCFLWPLRPYRDDRERPDGTVPTAEEYGEMIEGRTNSTSLAALAASKRDG